MKFILVVLVALIAGCASAPKVGQKSKASYPIVVGEKSSKALRDLHSVGVVGVRDLNAKELRRYQNDQEKFGAASRSRTGINAGAYSATTSAAAVAGGMALGSVTGVGLLSAMLADERPDNYRFALDFSDRYYIASLSGVDVNLLNSAIRSAVQDVTNFFAQSYSLSSTARDFTRDLSFSMHWLEPNRDRYSIGLEVEPTCASGSINCVFRSFSHLRKGGVRSPIEAALLVDFMSKLPESYFLYIPPNRSIYQLPAVIYGGGRVEYLVEVK